MNKYHITITSATRTTVMAETHGGVTFEEAARLLWQHLLSMEGWKAKPDEDWPHELYLISPNGQMVYYHGSRAAYTSEGLMEIFPSQWLDKAEWDARHKRTSV